MTYYKYVSREGADVVDWGAITKSVSESLGQVAKDREAKREAIDEASRKTGETLANAPMGESKTINDFTIEYANNAEKYRLMQDRLLRSGQMSLKDYNLGRANLTSGTTDLFNLSKEYNAVYADKMERMNKTESSLAEPWAMGNIEGYSNFSKSSAYIDPTNGRVAVGMKVKKTLPDGKEVFELSDNPNDLKSVNELRNIIDTKYDRFKVSQNLQTGVDELSETINVLMEDGVKTREDARQNPNYLNARNTFINSFIETNPDIPMSVLVDYLGVVPDKEGEPGEAFDFTYDPDEAATSNKFILMQPNENTGRYEAKLNDDQKEMARKALTAKFEAMVDSKDTAMPIEKKSDREKLRIGQVESAVDNIAKLWYGTTQEIDAASKFLKGIIPNLVGIDVQENKVILTKTDKDGSATGKKGSRYPVEYAREDFNLFIESISGELGGNVSASEAVNIATKSLPTGRTAKGGIGTFLIPEATGLTEKFGTYIETYLTETLPLSKDEDEAQSQLEGLLKPFGNFEIVTDTFGNELTITYPTGKGKENIELFIDLDDADAVRQIKNFLVNNIEYFQRGVEVQEKMIDEGPTKTQTKRNIAQIIKEDGVTPAEALKIFKAQ